MVQDNANIKLKNFIVVYYIYTLPTDPQEVIGIYSVTFSI